MYSKPLNLRIFTAMTTLPGYALFFMMLFAPLSYRNIKVALLGLVMVMITIHVLVGGKLLLHRTILLWTMLIMLCGSVFIFVGVINNTPGALYVAHFYILWPFVFTLLVAGIANENVIDRLIKTLVFSTIAISLYSLIYIFYAAGLIPDAFYIEIDQGQRIGFHEGYIHYTSASLYTLLFSVPFIISALLTWPKSASMPVSRLWLWIAVILSLPVVLLSARRSLWLIVAISPILSIIFNKLLRVKHYSFKTMCRMVLWFVFSLSVIFAFLHIVFNIEFFALVQRFTDAFQFNTSAGSILRREQFFALLEGWINNPLFGGGLGGGVEGSVRSAQTWQYELFYMSILFQTGVIGFTIYFAAIAWIYYMGFKMIKLGLLLGLYMCPILIGTSCFLIASATNPYLGTFSGIWPIFLPVALINIWLLKPNNPIIKSG